MKRNTLRVDSNINPAVKVGDRVKLTNAETLTHMTYQHDFDLLRKYPTLGIDKPLEDVVGRVTHTGITKFIVQREDKFVAYTQDIIVNVSGQMFRTSSGAVRVMKTPMEIIEDRLDSLKDFKPKSKRLQKEVAVSIELLEVLRDDIINHK